MITYNDLVQGSDEWLQCRVGKITASRAKDARDTLKSGKPSGKQIAYAAQVALERIAARPIDRTYENWQMREVSQRAPSTPLPAGVLMVAKRPSRPWYSTKSAYQRWA